MKKIQKFIIHLFKGFTKDEVEKYANIGYIKGIMQATDEMSKKMKDAYGCNNQDWIDIVYNYNKELSKQLKEKYEGL